jgi:hypothetical protein
MVAISYTLILTIYHDIILFPTLGRTKEELRTRRCGNCNATGHNVRTCQFVEETSEEDISE